MDLNYEDIYCPKCFENASEGYFRECSKCVNENGRPILKKKKCDLCDMVVCVKHLARHIQRWHADEEMAAASNGNNSSAAAKRKRTGKLPQVIRIHNVTASVGSSSRGATKRARGAMNKDSDSEEYNEDESLVATNTRQAPNSKKQKKSVPASSDDENDADYFDHDYHRTRRSYQKQQQTAVMKKESTSSSPLRLIAPVEKSNASNSSVLSEASIFVSFVNNNQVITEQNDAAQGVAPKRPKMSIESLGADNDDETNERASSLPYRHELRQHNSSPSNTVPPAGLESLRGRAQNGDIGIFDLFSMIDHTLSTSKQQQVQ